MRSLLLLFFVSIVTLSKAQDLKSYQIFDGQGKKVKYRKMVKKLQDADVVLFGEMHNNPVCHWLQMKLTKSLDQQRDLMLGAEMLEADNQPQLYQYLSGEIDQKALDSTARLWSNYELDYKPLVDYAKLQTIDFIATNIPRRYARAVFKGGFEVIDSLSVEEKAWIAPAPIAYDAELPGYKNMLTMFSHGGDVNENFPKAQAIKDATMAHFILKNRKPKQLFLHYNGAYHSDSYEGILWYLQQQSPDGNYKTISSVTQEQLISLDSENSNRADFVIVVDEDMVVSY